MRAEDLVLNELVEFSEGLVSLHGRRLVIHDVHAFAQFRKELVDSVGDEQARRILTRFGYYWGQADAAGMKRIFKWEDAREWLMAGPRLHTLQGVARTEVKSLTFDEASRTFHMIVAWHDSGEAEEHLYEFDRSDRPMCSMLVGYASGYASFCLGHDVYFVEEQCRAKGDEACLAVGKDAASWGADLKPHLPYFQADDIQGKVQKLTKELRGKTQELAKQRAQLARLELAADEGFFEVRSPAFQRVLDIAQRVARFDSSVLITGETGTGKEILARYIHALSKRAKQPFVGINCGALPETLLESELFGHKAGAFTGALRDRIGLFEEANKGTIFLDEIGETSPAMQVKLLRVLQERQIQPVGDSKTRQVDVRIMEATNIDLKQAVADGVFREDLLYRLCIVEIEMPPLRERREDILPLARYFAGKVGRRLGLPEVRLDASCLDYLLDYDWPGNVRELENVLERAAVFSADGLIFPECLPPNIVDAGKPSSAHARLSTQSLAEVEHHHIRRVLESVDGNRARAARILGISPSTLWRKLKRDEAQE